MIYVSDKITAKTREGILADSSQIAYVPGEVNPEVEGTVASVLNGVTETLYSTVFDVSLYNATRETEECLGVTRETGNIILAEYESLEAAMEAVPDDHKFGGMTLRFVKSPEEKYVQYFNNAKEWSSNVADWSDMNVADGIAENATGLANSGQVYEAVNGIMDDVQSFEDAIREQVENYKPIEITGDVTNAADEEDLTSVNGLLKFKDRSALNGKGYVIIRREKTVAEQMDAENTIYVIRYDMNLGGDSVTVPQGSILMFEGGSIKNGTIAINGAEIYPRYEFLTNGEQLTVTGNPAAGTHRYNANDGVDEYFDGTKWVGCARKDVIDGLVASVDEIESGLATAESRIDSTNRALAETNATLNAAVTDVAGLKVDVSGLRTDMDLANGRLNVINGQLDTISGKISTDEGNISALSSTTASLAGAIEVAAAEARQMVRDEAAERASADEALQGQVDILANSDVEINRKISELSGDTVHADEEDITLIDGKLKFKDKAYDSAASSGMGRVFVRKNVVEVYPNNTWMFGVYPQGHGGQAYLMYSYAGIVYGISNSTSKGLILSENIIKESSTYDRSALPEFVTSFLPYTKSGSLFTIALPNGTTITSTTLDGMQIKNVEDISILEKCILTQEQISEPNTVYVIQYDHDLNLNTITVPANSTLLMMGGSLNNGKVNLNGAAVYPNYDSLSKGTGLTISGKPKAGTYSYSTASNRPLFYNGNEWVDGEGVNLDTRIINV